jgi:hypothetical protein
MDTVKYCYRCVTYLYVEYTGSSHYIKTIWYVIIHDILPTNHRLHNINRHANGKCKYCQEEDTVLHRYTTCTETHPIWTWTRKHIACYLRTNIKDILDEWICAPDFELQPIQRHNATIWLLGQMLCYVHNNHSLTMKDYLDFLKRARLKEYSRPHGYKKYGKCHVLDEVRYELLG